MARPLAFYHVINRGQSRLHAEIAWLGKVKIYAYCLMSNDCHLLVSTPAAVSSVFLQMKSRSAQEKGSLCTG
ncbi:MAG TPA: hypothetical protein VE170_12130 [Candidatus Limnocylindria bacterium]|nr:hypothetical protein [Candidatus Limnocylindria bacterium]